MGVTIKQEEDSELRKNGKSEMSTTVHALMHCSLILTLDITRHATSVSCCLLFSTLVDCDLGLWAKSIFFSLSFFYQSVLSQRWERKLRYQVIKSINSEPYRALSTWLLWVNQQPCLLVRSWFTNKYSDSTSPPLTTLEYLYPLLVNNTWCLV